MGKPRNTRKYPTYPEIPEIPGNTRKKKRYPEIPDRIFRHSYPTRTRPATRYFVQYPTRPDPILKNPTRWALMTETLIKWRRDLLYCHPSHNLCPPPHKLCCSSFGDLNSNFLKIKMTYSSKNLSRYMIQKEKKKIKTEVGWNFCQLMKTLDF